MTAATPHSAPLPLDADALRAALAQRGAPPLRLEVHEAIDSTNDRARSYLLQTPPPSEPLLVAADYQRSGRGRMGRAWVSPPRVNALFSLALPSAWVPPDRRAALNLAAAVAVCRALETMTGLRPGIKWPNDVELDGAKLAGVLCETTGGPESGAIVGIGINVNWPIEQDAAVPTRPIASLLGATGRPWPREAIIADVVGRLLSVVASTRPRSWSAMMQAWRARCTTLGRWVCAQWNGFRLEGTAAGIDDDGALLVRDVTGRLHRLAAGEVSLTHLGPGSG